MIRAPSIRLLPALALLLCAAVCPLSAQAGPQSLLAGCTAEPFGGEGWSYECDDFSAILSDHAGVSAQRLWQRSRRTFQRQAEGGVTFKVVKASLAGRKVRLLRMRAKVPEAQEDSVFAVVPVKGKGARRVLCKGRSCRPVVGGFEQPMNYGLYGQSWFASSSFARGPSSANAASF